MPWHDRQTCLSYLHTVTQELENFRPCNPSKATFSYLLPRTLLPLSNLEQTPALFLLRPLYPLLLLVQYIRHRLRSAASRTTRPPLPDLYSTQTWRVQETTISSYVLAPAPSPSTLPIARSSPLTLPPSSADQAPPDRRLGRGQVVLPPPLQRRLVHAVVHHDHRHRLQDPHHRARRQARQAADLGYGGPGAVSDHHDGVLPRRHGYPARV